MNTAEQTHSSWCLSQEAVSISQWNQAQLQGQENKGLLQKPFLSHLGTCPSVLLSRFQQPEATITSISSISSCAAKIADTVSMYVYRVENMCLFGKATADIA